MLWLFLLVAILILVNKKGVKIPRIKKRPKIIDKKKIMESLLKHDHVQVKKENIESIEEKRLDHVPEGFIIKSDGNEAWLEKNKLF